MSNIPTILPKPPVVAPGAATFNRRWPLLNKWFTDLIVALQKNFSLIGQDFDAIQTPYSVSAGPFPIVVAGTAVNLGSVLATISDVTQMVLIIANLTLTTDAGNDPVSFILNRGNTFVAGDYLPAVGAGATVSKTLIGIDSNLPVGQYTYNFLAQTLGGAGNTDVTAAKIGALVI